MKARLLGTSADEILRDGGNFPLDTLKDMIQTKYYEDMPPVYRDTLNEIESELGREADPLVFSAMVDGAMFRTMPRRSADAKHEKDRYLSILLPAGPISKYTEPDPGPESPLGAQSAPPRPRRRRRDSPDCL